MTTHMKTIRMGHIEHCLPPEGSNTCFLKVFLVHRPVGNIIFV